jgi:hypothetical protein
MARKLLLLCGILSSLVYVGGDLLAAMRYEGYSYTSQAISELSAVGAPTASFLLLFYVVYDLLLIAFGFGVWSSARDNRALRISADLLIAIGLVGFVWMLFPMHQRGAAMAFTDIMHIVIAAVQVLLILTAIGFGAAAFGKRFRLYSIATLAVLVVSGIVTGMDGARLAANAPTPWLGVTERINLGAYLLWVAVLALTAWRAPAAATASRNLSKGEPLWLQYTH